MEGIYSFLSEGMDRRPAYGFSHRLRAAVEKEQITPSPLDYRAEKVTLGNSSRSFTFGHRPRTNYVIDDDTPGPGEYFISEEIKRRRKSGFTFGSRSAAKRTRSPQTPGPQYKPEDPGSFQPQRGFSFGHRPRFGRRISDIPGPGEYETGEKFIFKNTPAYTFGVKNHVRGKSAFLQNLTPGPGEHFNFGDVTKKSAPAYSFGTRARPRIFAPDFDQPGPGEYESNRPVYSSAVRGFSFGMRLPTLIK